MPDTTPEVLYDRTLPEACGNEESTEEHLHVTRSTRKWPWILMALILTAAIAIGVSVGIWHKREHSLHKSQSPQYILNDTSLAAVLADDGDRHLFFQDNTGLIRRAVRVESNGQWTTSLNLNASANPYPKRHTPLTASGLSLFKDVLAEIK